MYKYYSFYRLILLIILCFGYGAKVKSAQNSVIVPFSTDSNQLTFWNGKTYIPFFIKGVNLGIAKPGTYPGELEATREQYKRWFTEIKAAGFNCIRIYTLHFPHFYEELRKFNLSNKQHPLFFFQGTWLNEELAGYKNDLYQLTDTFKTEVEENVDCVHGNRIIPPRFGKAYGTFTADASPWNIGYIIGREVYPDEILTSNDNHPTVNSFTGTHFSINNASPSEVWWTKNIDHLVDYEKIRYNSQRPVSISSWPTLDPIKHVSEPNRLEDTASVDLSKIKIIDAPAGFFISYHAYPYYPDFIGKDASYQAFSDSYGTNSYIGYLTDLKSHYKQYPLIIAEYGVPSSWGVAHYTSSGMNHGGFDELTQGQTDIRLLNSIKVAKAGGGIQFSWIDEWFKKTWITDLFDFGNRILWHNITSAEQNFGIVKFKKKNDSLIPWKTFTATDDITNLKGSADYTFFQMEIGLRSQMDVLGECWVAFDTYDIGLGESVLPNGATVPYRSEFALHITQHSAELYVTEAYDLFGMWHRSTTANQKLQSTITNGAPWQLVRWKNNSGNSDVQFIGNLTLNRSFQPETSKDAVTIFDNKIHIRLPWSLLQVEDPSQMLVIHDNKSTLDTETRETDGIAVSVYYKNKLYNSGTRFIWNKWNTLKDTDVEEDFKTSYWTMYNQLTNFNSPAISLPDTFDLRLKEFPYSINAADGLLKNDFDADGEALIAVLMESPSSGYLDLNADGSFIYLPKSGFEGIDVFSYSIFDGQSLSKPTNVTLQVSKSDNLNGNTDQTSIIKLYPNPASGFVKLDSKVNISNINIFDRTGVLIMQKPLNAKFYSLNISTLRAGFYYVVTEIGGRSFANKLIVK